MQNMKVGDNYVNNDTYLSRWSVIQNNNNNVLLTPNQTPKLLHIKTKHKKVS